MSKSSGGVRNLAVNLNEKAIRHYEVSAMRSSEKYERVIETKAGGYLAIEKSKYKHKIEEIEAGTFLAEKGYKVILIDEAGSVKTPDGYIFNATFEQKTPVKTKFSKCLEHAKNKNTNKVKIDIAVIYDKHKIYNKLSIEKGIKEYEYEDKNKYRFKQIIVISKGGDVYRHYHNKK